MSGTFESLVYDELVERGAPSAVPDPDRLGALDGPAWPTCAPPRRGAACSTSAATPLVGWTSVAICGCQALLAATLPVSVQRAGRPSHDSPLAETERAASRYVAMLRAGLSESRHHPDVRRVLLLAAAMVGLTAYDEYFPLVARATASRRRTVPLLIAVTVAGQASARPWSAGPPGSAAPAIGGVLAAGAVLVSLGALATPYARLRRDRGRLRAAQQRHARRRDPAAGHDHRPGPGDRDQRARADRGGRRARRVRRVLARLARARLPDPGRTAGHPGRARRDRRGPLAAPTGRPGVSRILRSAYPRPNLFGTRSQTSDRESGRQQQMDFKVADLAPGRLRPHRDHPRRARDARPDGDARALRRRASRSPAPGSPARCT